MSAQPNRDFMSASSRGRSEKLLMVSGEMLRSNLIVRLERPAAREHEAQLKAEKEQKARSSVSTS